MRKLSIDGKFGVSEQGDIVKLSNGEVVPKDEPLFLVRGRDRLAVTLLQYYGAISVLDGCNQWHMDKLTATIKNFEKFRDEHPERMKQPSITMGK